jgi:outer membrane protein assembly factor BamB
MDGPTCVLMHLGTDGKERWRKPLGAGDIRTRGDEGGNLASASCSTDGTRVIAFAGSGKLAAFDFAGTELWAVNLVEKTGDFTNTRVIQFGGHWTPVLDRGTVYAAVLHRKAQKVMAFDAATGKEKWAADRPSDSPPGTESPDGYASPFVWRDGDRACLVVHGNDYCTGHDLTDGRELWRVTELNPKAAYNRAWRAISCPLVTPDLIVVPSCKRGVTVALDPRTAAGRISPGGPAEKWRLPRNTPDVPSPIRVGDAIYLMGEGGKLMAVDAATGKELFYEVVTNERHRANPVFADGKLILVGRDGTMPVVKPGPSLEVLAKNKLPDTFTASPAVAGDRLYLRGWKALYAVGK